MSSSQLLLAMALASSIGGVSADGHLTRVLEYVDDQCTVPAMKGSEPVYSVLPKVVDSCEMHPADPEISFVWGCKGEDGGMEEGPMMLSMYEDGMCGTAPAWSASLETDEVRSLKAGRCAMAVEYKDGDMTGVLYWKAPGPLRDLETCQDATGKSTARTCGEVKMMYKHNECCGNPTKPFEAGRRLQDFKTDDYDVLVAKVRQALKNAYATGGVANAKKLADKIRNKIGTV